MSNKNIIILVCCFACSIIIITCLYAISHNNNHKNNSFVRLFPPHPINEPKILDIKYNSYYISGATKSKIYLGNWTTPFHLLEINSKLNDTSNIKLKFETLSDIILKSYEIKIDSPYFYLTDGSIPKILRGKINDWYGTHFMFDSLYFNQAVPINSSSLVIRVLDGLTQEYMLAKETAEKPNFKIVPNLLQKQIDGIFCVDGMLHFNSSMNQIIYLYYYRNQYIVMDTSLNLVYRGATIDTISHAKITVAGIKSEHSLTMASPPLIVNKNSCTYKDWLFVNSNLIAKNEDKEMFNQASVIDVYNLKSRTYQFSFYLFDYNEKKMKSFQVYNNKLLAIYDHYLMSYDLNPQHFTL